MKIVLSIYFSLLALFSFGQCELNLGEDITICVDINGNTDTVNIKPNIANSIGNLSPSWSFSYNIGRGNFILATDILSDTTSIETKIIHSDALPNNTFLPLYLNIQDSVGNTCNDTIMIRFSKFSSTLGKPYPDPIMLSVGEEITLSPCYYGGIPPLEYNWLPKYNIDDFTSSDPTIFPFKDTTYTLKIIDSMGCVSPIDSIHVVVDSSFVNTLKKEFRSVTDLKIYPNPLDKFLNINVDEISGKFNIEILDFRGIALITRDLTAGANAIDTKLLPRGTFIIQIKKDEKLIESFKIIK